jgi:hypothetical protein
MAHRRPALFNAHMPINKISSGVGLSAYFDKLGQQKQQFRCASATASTARSVPEPLASASLVACSPTVGQQLDRS